MLKYFVCPDGELVEIQDCWNGCRMGRRCLTLPTLVYVGTQREPGAPSTTQLLNGTMYEYLKHTYDYAIKPSSKAFALLGTRHHEMLSEVADKLGLPAEISVTDDDRNIFDLLEMDGDQLVLTDYKTWGSFKVAKAMGIVVVDEQQVHYTDKAGRKRTKTDKTWGIDPEQADNWEAELQLNNYRIHIEHQLDRHVDRMQLQVTVRDGGTFVATGRGVTELIYLIEIPRIHDKIVEDYFTQQATNLNWAIHNNETPVEPCTPRERWHNPNTGKDARCQGYCEVWNHCPHGRQVKLGGS